MNKKILICECLTNNVLQSIHFEFQEQWTYMAVTVSREQETCRHTTPCCAHNMKLVRPFSFLPPPLFFVYRVPLYFVSFSALCLAVLVSCECITKRFRANGCAFASKDR